MAESKKRNKNKDKDKDQDVMDNTRMSLGDHLMELRSRLIKSIIGLLVGFGICVFFGGEIVSFLAAPAIAALKANGFEATIHELSPAEGFMTHIKVSIIAGLFLVSPWIFHQLWGFVAAGLYRSEKRFVNVFVPFSALLFVLGGLFFITIVAPISFNFFIQFSGKWQASGFSDNSFYNMLLGVDTEEEDVPAGGKKGPSNDVPLPGGPDALQETLTVDISNAPGGSAINSIRTMRFNSTDSLGDIATAAGNDHANSLISYDYRLKEYISFVLMLSLAFGLAFQMPLAVFFLGRLGMVSIATFRSVRKYVLLGIVIFSAVITPPDVISQLCMSFPMYILYEIGILLLMFWGVKKE